MTSYINPWHKPETNDYGPAIYQTDATPTEYKGYLIYHRGAVYDVVKNGACVTQMAGPNGARQAIDKLVDPPRRANRFYTLIQSADGTAMTLDLDPGTEDDCRRGLRSNRAWNEFQAKLEKLS
jgi:hypothetical protein